MDNNGIEIYVPFVFYEAFLKAIERLQDTKRKVEIIKEKEIKNRNEFYITVKCEHPIDYYYLGIQFMNEKEKV